MWIFNFGSELDVLGFSSFSDHVQGQYEQGQWMNKILVRFLRKRNLETREVPEIVEKWDMEPSTKWKRQSNNKMALESKSGGAFYNCPCRHCVKTWKFFCIVYTKKREVRYSLVKNCRFDFNRWYPHRSKMEVAASAMLDGLKNNRISKLALSRFLSQSLWVKSRIAIQQHEIDLTLEIMRVTANTITFYSINCFYYRSNLWLPRSGFLHLKLTCGNVLRTHIWRVHENKYFIVNWGQIRSLNKELGSKRCQSERILILVYI